jgi:hypothetical protein
MSMTEGLFSPTSNVGPFYIPRAHLFSRTRGRPSPAHCSGRSAPSRDEPLTARLVGRTALGVFRTATEEVDLYQPSLSTLYANYH